LGGLIDEGRKGALRGEREEGMPRRNSQRHEARERIARRVRDTERSMSKLHNWKALNPLDSR
jgi:hypothetical protein